MIKEFCSIDINEICNGKSDCLDKSDEIDCESIVFDNTYLKYEAPVPDGNNLVAIHQPTF